ncbi:pilus assembly protein [Roseiarcaceae bacterium H3SJ34-1]|uniref:TadE/TadG family type IV pilus assembly protein n=1 Tax=Terripilifer ovatus TaxID=3032367 RepID=UPI003AB95175|nr:pilus assembly protein [Roseiarcaceae bacterium H3SJ34-1]
MRKTRIWGAIGRRLAVQINRFRQNRSASMAVTFSLALVPILIGTGIAIDYSRSLAVKARLQTALDSATMTVAQTTNTDATTLGTTVLNASLADTHASMVVGSWSRGSDGSATGTATAVVATTFLNLIHRADVTVSAASKVAAKSTASLSNVCILVLDPASSQTLLVNSGVTINAPNCEIDVASKGSPAAIFNSAATLNVAKICVAGTNTIQNGGTVSALSTNCTTAADPFAGTLPAPSSTSCTVSNQNYSGTNTLTPGVYCGNFNFNGTGTLNLQPGVYVFNNTRWNLNSGWTVNGTGVTFYFADANSYIQVNSGVAINISAPTSGTYANLLIYEPVGLSKSSFSINGSAGHSFTGLIYLPSRNITFNSVSTVSSENITIVVNQIILDQINWTFASSAKTINGASTTSAAGGTGSGTNYYFVR